MRRPRSHPATWVVDMVSCYARGDRPAGPVPTATGTTVRRAADAGVLAVVAAVLEEAELPVPVEVRDWTEGLGLAKLRQRADLVTLVECLERADVRWVLIKGPVLDQVVYRVPGLRRYIDLDVLVHPSDFARAWEHLKSVAVDVDLNWARLALTEQSEISMRLPLGTTLDLHWHVISNRLVRRAFDLDVRYFFDETRQVTLEGRSVPTLSPRDTALHVALHASLAGGHELRWLLDLHQCLADAALLDLWPRARELRLELVLETMAARVGVLDRDQAASAPRGRLRPSQRVWAGLCRMVGEVVPVCVGDMDRYTGRVVFSSTRTRLHPSLTALASAVRSVRRAGKDRRTAAIDRRALWDPGGTEADLRRWLGVIADDGAAAPRASGAV